MATTHSDIGLDPGSVAVVTGAASGIGRASAVAFASHGARVALVDINADGLRNTAKEIASRGGQTIQLIVDLANPDDVSSLVPAVVSEWGRLDYAHNNAGLSGLYHRVEEYDEETFDRILQVNLLGVWRCLKHEITHMRQHSGGAIVNTSSIFGNVGMANNSAYTAAKHGVNGLTRSAALDGGAAGIRVNAVAPGPTDTGMLSPASQTLLQRMPLGRRATPPEIGDVVVWLCSPAASFITGAVIPVDGGYLAS